MQVSLSQEEVVLVGSEQMGHGVRIPEDFDFVVQSRDQDSALCLRGGLSDPDAQEWSEDGGDERYKHSMQNANRKMQNGREVMQTR